MIERNFSDFHQMLQYLAGYTECSVANGEFKIDVEITPTEKGFRIKIQRERL